MPQYHFRADPIADPAAPILFLFHGTGGDENQFFDFAGGLLPGARRVAPLGDVRENGAARFFRRAAEGVYDMEDLALRTRAMADFIGAQIGETKPAKVLGLGYSNGANILASVQFLAPELFDATVLMHPLIPFTPQEADFSGRSVLITAGRHDPIAPAPRTQALWDYFTQNGAQAELAWHPGGHDIRPEEIEAIEGFMRIVAP
jgi:phospholipase/carboxylesterase